MSKLDEVESDSSVTGFAKMAKVVEIVLPKVPEIAAEIAGLPNLETFLLQFGQTVWSAAIAKLESAAVPPLAKLI